MIIDARHHGTAVRHYFGAQRSFATAKDTTTARNIILEHTCCEGRHWQHEQRHNRDQQLYLPSRAEVEYMQVKMKQSGQSRQAGTKSQAIAVDPETQAVRAHNNRNSNLEIRSEALDTGTKPFSMWRANIKCISDHNNAQLRYPSLRTMP